MIRVEKKDVSVKMFLALFSIKHSMLFLNAELSVSTAVHLHAYFSLLEKNARS